MSVGFLLQKRFSVALSVLQHVGCDSVALISHESGNFLVSNPFLRSSFWVNSAGLGLLVIFLMPRWVLSLCWQRQILWGEVLGSSVDRVSKFDFDCESFVVVDLQYLNVDRCHSNKIL